MRTNYRPRNVALQPVTLGREQALLVVSALRRDAAQALRDWRPHDGLDELDSFAAQRALADRIEAML